MFVLFMQSFVFRFLQPAVCCIFTASGCVLGFELIYFSCLNTLETNQPSMLSECMKISPDTNIKTDQLYRCNCFKHDNVSLFLSLCMCLTLINSMLSLMFVTDKQLSSFAHIEKGLQLLLLCPWLTDLMFTQHASSQ